MAAQNWSEEEMKLLKEILKKLNVVSRLALRTQCSVSRRGRGSTVMQGLHLNIL